MVAADAQETILTQYCKDCSKALSASKHCMFTDLGQGDLMRLLLPSSLYVDTVMSLIIFEGFGWSWSKSHSMACSMV